MFFLVPWRIVTCMKRLPLSKCRSSPVAMVQKRPDGMRWIWTLHGLTLLKAGLMKTQRGYRITIFRIAGQPDSTEDAVFDGGCLDAIHKSTLRDPDTPLWGDLGFATESDTCQQWVLLLGSKSEWPLAHTVFAFCSTLSRCKVRCAQQISRGQRQHPKWAKGASSTSSLPNDNLSAWTAWTGDRTCFRLQPKPFFLEMPVICRGDYYKALSRLLRVWCWESSRQIPTIHGVERCKDSTWFLLTGPILVLERRKRSCVPQFLERWCMTLTVKNRNCRHRICGGITGPYLNGSGTWCLWDAEIPRKLDQKPQLVITR